VWPEQIGVVGGAGALALLLAFLNRNYERCPPAPHSGTTYPGYRTPTCTGGTNPIFWLVVGVVLVLASVVAFVAVRTAQRRATTG
jgi:hypothetical protein